MKTRGLSFFVTLLFLIQLVAFGQWNPLNTGFQAVRSATTFDGDLYVAHNNGISKSTDNGTSWTAANSGITQVSGQYNVRSVGHNGTYLFAGTQSGIYRSNDAGTTWTNVNGSLTASAQVYANKFYQFGNATFAIFTGSIADGGGIHRTNNNGTTWLIGNSGMGTNATCYQITTDGTSLYAATSVGLYKSTDGGQQWSSLPGSNFSIYAVQKVGNRLIAITSFGFRYSTNDGTTWSESTGDPSNPTKGELIAYDGKLFAISSPGGVTRSIDNGATFAPFVTGLSAVDQVAPDKFHASGNRLYLTALQDLNYVSGTTVYVEDLARYSVPTVYPTLVTDGFFVDLKETTGVKQIVLIDAIGKEVMRQNVNSSSLIRVERQGLVTGTYRVLMIDRDGMCKALGNVIAE